MGKPTGFIEIGRRLPERRPVHERLRDSHELEGKLDHDNLQLQAARCMDCGVPFCHQGCPLGNLIPEWNDRVYRDDMAGALERLLLTNNFPEITGRVCPAPCEAACVLTGAGDQAVTIKQVEKQIAAYDSFTPHLPAKSLQRSAGIIGSGPAGLAAAQQLARAGAAVTVYERSDAIGGLLRYGIPEFKLDRTLLGKRLAQLAAEGVRFVTGAQVTSLELPHDAVIIATGASAARDLPLPGRATGHVHLAMEYLTAQQKGRPISAHGKHVVILGGGDTGSDCLGTALRQGAASVKQLELMPRPPDAPQNAWPEWPFMYRTSSSQEEGGERMFAVQTREFVTGGVIAESEGRTLHIPADLILLALGFTGVDHAFGLAVDARGSIVTDADYRTSNPRVFACGDARRGASLVVWAIAEGRRAAASVLAEWRRSA